MRLFDDLQRDELGPRPQAEPEFSYLNGSGRGAVDRIRQLLEQWFSEFPVGDDKKDVREKFRSPIAAQHQGAFFELFLHALHRSSGCCLSLHPRPANGTGRRPDFLVQPPNSPSFYLEGTIATGESDIERGQQASLATLQDELNKLNSPNFFIGVELRGSPRTQPPGRKLRAFLEARLRDLDPDKVLAASKNERQVFTPRWEYEHDGLRLVFFPIPKSESLRGKPGVRPLGLWFPGMQWGVGQGDIEMAIRRKANRYGSLDRPYVVAVSVLEEALDTEDIISALFGRSASFGTAEKPRNRRISAALIATRLYPWSVPRAQVCLYHHPWAHTSLEWREWPFRQARHVGGKLEWSGGISVAQAFKLPDSWPEVKDHA